MKILIIKPSSLGDIVHGLQVAQSIREQLPGCEIDWVVKDRFLPVVEACNTVDEIYVFHRGGGLGKFITLIKKIRRKRYDYVLDFQGLARSGVMTFFAKGEKKLGRKDAREGAGLFYHVKIPLPKKKEQSHAVEVLLNFLPEMGLEKKILGKVEYNNLKELEKIDKRLANKNPILVIPHSRQPRKEWWGFSGLVQEILSNYPDEVVVWDSHKQTPIPKLDGRERFINASGKTGVKEMIALVSNAKLVIANDSGPMHIAAAMKVPVLGIFGPTPPERFGPYPLNGETNRYIKEPKGDLNKLEINAVSSIAEELLERCKKPMS